MTSYDWEVVAVALCVSIVAGVIFGVLVQHTIKLAITCIAVVALVFFCTLEWRFGGPQTWPWQDAARQNVFMFGALFFVIALPMFASVVLSRSWAKRRNSSNQSLQPTAGRSDV